MGMRAADAMLLLAAGCHAPTGTPPPPVPAQSCQVSFTIQRGTAAAREQHTIQAQLTAEGGRLYRLDGRVRTAAQVREFLRRCGLAIDPATVIRQANVTALTDDNRGWRGWVVRVPACPAARGCWPRARSRCRAHARRCGMGSDAARPRRAPATMAQQSPRRGLASQELRAARLMALHAVCCCRALPAGAAGGNGQRTG